MIQPTLSPAMPSPILPGEDVGLFVAEGLKTADFAAVLAKSAASPEIQNGAGFTEPTVPDSKVLQAVIPAKPGKVLPSALPVIDLEIPKPAELVQPKTARIETNLRSPSVERETPFPALEPVKDELTELIEAPALAILPTVAPSMVSVASIKPEVAAHSARPNLPGQTDTQTRMIGEPSLATVSQSLPTAIGHQASIIASTKGAIKAVVSAVAAPAQLVTSEAVVPDAPAPAQQPKPTPVRLIPAAEVRIELAFPRLAVAAALPKSEANLALGLADDAAPEFSHQSPAFPTQPQAFVPAAAAPQVRPHDFAALIDRLTLARDVANPQAISMTVVHQDFGAVRLNFRAEDAGLAVVMSNADPEFARAAASTPAPVVPATPSEQTASSQSRSDNAPAQSGQSGDFGQSREQASQRRDDRGQPLSNPSPRAEQNRSGRRSGIFA